jgi:hypothetical protein
MESFKCTHCSKTKNISELSSYGYSDMNRQNIVRKTCKSCRKQQDERTICEKYGDNGEFIGWTKPK